MNNKIKDLTENFSVENFTFSTGTISKNEVFNTFEIIIPIEKFILNIEIIETQLHFSTIKLKDALMSYSGKTVSFPVNPIEGYIDCSIYLLDAHNPVDISEMKFISLENEILKVELTMDFVFEFEGIGFKNEKLVREVDLKIE